MATPTDFEWDEAKAASNVAKHGLPFAEALAVFADPDHIVTDARRDRDGEARQKIIGLIGDAMFTVVFVMRNSTCRIISARRANAKEERIYGNRSI